MAAPHRVPPRVRHDDRPLSQRGIRQPTLMDAPDKATLAFLDYHHKNPEVWALFRDICLRLYNAGVRHYGAKCLFEVLRFETIIRGRDDAFKINNSYVSRYSRLLMANDSRFDGFFAVRQLRQSKGKRA